MDVVPKSMFWFQSSESNVFDLTNRFTVLDFRYNIPAMLHRRTLKALGHEVCKALSDKPLAQTIEIRKGWKP